MSRYLHGWGMRIGAAARIASSRTEPYCSANVRASRRRRKSPMTKPRTPPLGLRTATMYPMPMVVAMLCRDLGASKLLRVEPRTAQHVAWLDRAATLGWRYHLVLGARRYELVGWPTIAIMGQIDGVHHRGFFVHIPLRVRTAHA